MTFYFSVHSHKFQTEVISFSVWTCAWLQAAEEHLKAPFKKYSCQQHLVTFPLPPRLQMTHTLKKKEPVTDVALAERRQKDALIYVLLLKGLEGIWRVCFFPPLSLSLALSLFLKLASQEGEL